MCIIPLTHILILYIIFIFIDNMLPDIDKRPEKQQLIFKMAGYLEKKGRMVSIGILYVSSSFVII